MPDPQFPPGPAEFMWPFECSRTGGTMDAAWVHVAGALDIATTPRLERTLRESETRLVVLDLRDVAFMDCSGVHAIVDATRRARQLGRRLLLLRGPPHVDRVFALTGYVHDVETGDLGPVESPVASLQRALVASSLLKSHGNVRQRGRSR